MLKKLNNSWFVYILACDDKTLYTGITNNLRKRLEIHQSGKGAKYTKTHGAKEIVYSHQHSNRSEATKHELRIKNLTKQKKLELINEFRNTLSKSH